MSQFSLATQYQPIPGAENLTTSYVNHIIQRDDGFIWMATTDGISRYDGKNFINHEVIRDNPASLPNPWVSYLLEDHQQRLWAATAGGLTRLAVNGIGFETYINSPSDPHSLSGNNVLHLFEDAQQRLWIATERGLSQYLPASNGFHNHHITQTPMVSEKNHINVVGQRDANTLWVGNEDGLHLFDIPTGEFTPFVINHPQAEELEVYDLATDQQGGLWVVTAYHGAFYWDPISEAITLHRHDPNNPNSLSSDELWSLMIDVEQQVWITTWGEGINQITTDGQVIRHQHIRGNDHSIPSNMTTDVFQDQTGLIWVATAHGVVMHQPHNPFNILRPIAGQTQSLSSDMVWSFLETHEAIWIGTSEGLNRLDKSDQSIQPLFAGLERQANDHVSVWVMREANEQLMWLGTDGGPALFNTEDHSLRYAHSLVTTDEALKKQLQQPVWYLSNSQSGHVWVGTNGSSLYALNEQLEVVTDHTPLIKATLAQYDNIEFTHILEDGDNLWLGTTRGLFFFDTAQKRIELARSLTGAPMFDQDWIYSVEQFWQNQYWVSSQFGGLSLIQINADGSIEKLLQFDQNHPNISDRSIHVILVVNEHEVWFTGKRNLYHLDYDSKKITNYGSSYFDPNIAFHENSQFIASNGRMYMGSNRGAIEFDLSKLNPNNQPLPLYFTGINSDSTFIANRLNPDPPAIPQQNTQLLTLEQPIHRLQAFTFPHSDRIFSFQFAALDYLNAAHLHYAYRIPELNDQWIDLRNNNELTLTNLAPGNYQLQVKATNAGLQWGEELAALQFEVRPKPWLTWWAKLLYATAILGIGLTIFRLYQTRLLTQYALAHRETQLSQAIWGSGDELWEWDIKQQTITRMNSAELDDHRTRSFSGSFADNTLNIHEDDLDNLQRKINDILEGKTDEFDAIYRQQKKSGEWVWLQDRAKVTAKNDAGLPRVINGISRNISSIKENEERSLLITSAFQSSSDGAIVLDADFKIISINAAFTAITGFDERLLNKYMPWRNGPLSTSDMPSSELFQMIADVVLKGGSYHGEVMMDTADGHQIPVDLRVNCIYNEKKIPSHYIATLTDITYRKNTEEELKQLANYDALTGLPNRSWMMIRLQQFLQRAQHNDSHMAVMFVDLDHFKNINDSLGHSIGDELLVAAAKRLEQCVRKSDMVARIGGDEFTIGIIDYASISDVIRVAEKVLKKMSKPFQLTNHELIITPSIGIATYNQDNTDVETLLMQADTAMYHAKESGRNNFQFFTEFMNEAVLNRVDVEMRLRKALKNKELVLHFQPKFNVKSGRLAGFEALIRWQSENNDLIPPDDFIPIAEETGLIASIGKFVLDRACRQLSLWHQQGHTDIHIAINLSAVQFMDKNLVKLISNKLRKYDLKAESLELEITESTLIDNFQYTIKTLNELRDLGVKLSLDDFGTGFSSLNYLKQFPIHALKIDRTFIQDIETDHHDASMVQSIITLAHNLSIEVVAEGVETMGQLELLKSYQIEEIQGFLLSKPDDARGATAFLTSGQTITSIINDPGINQLNAGSSS
ncbi:EAL domain-containing protein [Marinicella meishanensis]|uniref:EAL domain-containing protein n=1 Tax=Marinicella meishanensis TaxID=2873263 RepID=UPI001CC02041|nr:EAL domain-containing protein [Marinicella sp. NBU2979]